MYSRGRLRALETAGRFCSWVEAGMVIGSFCGLFVRTREGLIRISSAGLDSEIIVRYDVAMRAACIPLVAYDAVHDDCTFCIDSMGLGLCWEC